MQITKERFNTILNEEIKIFLEVKRGSKRKGVLARGVWPKDEAPLFDGFKDFYRFVDANPQLKKVLATSRSGRRLPKGGKDFRWGPAHRKTYKAAAEIKTAAEAPGGKQPLPQKFYKRPEGKIRITAEEERQIKDLRKGLEAIEAGEFPNFFDWKDEMAGKVDAKKQYQTAWDRYLKAKKAQELVLKKYSAARMSPKARAISELEVLTAKIENGLRLGSEIQEKIKGKKLDSELGKTLFVKLEKEIEEFYDKRNKLVKKLNDMAKTEPMEPEAPETPEVPEDFEDPTEDLTFVTERDLRTEGAKEFGLNIKQAFVFAKILKNTKLKRYQNKEEVANRVKNIWSPEVLLYFTDVGNNIEDPAAILAKENWYTDEKKILYPKPESGLAEKYPNLKDGVHPEEIEALRKKKKGQAKRLAVLRTAFPETAKKIKRARKNRPTVINAFPPRKLESGDYDFSEFDKLKDKEVVSWINGLKYNKKHYPKGEWTEAMEATLQYLINKRYLTNKKYLKSLNKDKKGL